MESFEKAQPGSRVQLDFLHPDQVYEQVREGAAGPGVGYYSTCRTCEIGMSRAVGRPYRSLVHLVREALLGG